MLNVEAKTVPSASCYTTDRGDALSAIARRGTQYTALMVMTWATVRRALEASKVTDETPVAFLSVEGCGADELVVEFDGDGRLAVRTTRREEADDASRQNDASRQTRPLHDAHALHRLGDQVMALRSERYAGVAPIVREAIDRLSIVLGAAGISWRFPPPAASSRSAMNGPSTSGIQHD
jgi:hypothetical protein